MTRIILNALLLGFSTGISCLATCSPFFLPYLVAEQRKLKTDLREFAKFLIGRLAGYLAFGMIFGFLGAKLNRGWLSTLTTLSLGLLAFFIILYSLNLFKPDLCWRRYNLKMIKKIRLPFWIGLFSGVNLCPPFLLSLNYVFILGQIWQGLIFFLFFFLATNVYFVPLVFFGRLSRLREFQLAARWTALAVGIIFLAYAVYSIIINQSYLHL